LMNYLANVEGRSYRPLLRRHLSSRRMKNHTLRQAKVGLSPQKKRRNRPKKRAHMGR